MVNKPVSVIFSSKAQKQITDAWLWYEERQAGLGDRLIAEVAKKTKIVEQAPERYPIRYKSYREVPISIFPYILIYTFNKRKNLVYILSIFHTSINPKKKYK
jgi:plasmid stabilization system protein ParE